MIQKSIEFTQRNDVSDEYPTNTLLSQDDGKFSFFLTH